MNHNRWIYAAKYTSYGLVMVLLYVLQTTPNFLTILNIRPNLVACAAVGIAALEGEYMGGLYGALAGTLCDLGGFSLFGFNAILLMASCIVIGLVMIYMLRQTIINYVLLLGGALLIRGLLDYLLHYVMWGYENVWMVFFYRILPVVIYTAAVSPLIYYLFVWLHQKFAARLEQ